MPITTDSQVTWIRQVNSTVQEMNSKIFRQLLKHVNSNKTPSDHAHRLTTGLFSLIERETNTGETNHVVAYTSSGQIQLLNAQLFHDQRNEWYALLDNTTTNQPPHDLLMARITQIRDNAKQQLSAGGRNLILDSNQQLTVRDAANLQYKVFSVAQYDWSSVNNLTISAEVKCNDLQGGGDGGLSVQIKAIMSNNEVKTIHATLIAPIESYSGRISKTYDFADLKIKNVEFAVILITKVSSNNDIVICKPKLEIGNIATGWTPAVEDVGVEEDL